jgi:hypothetical protein
MDDGRQGFLLPHPADIGALAEKMRLLLDIGKRSTMGDAARQLALEHTFDRQTQSFLALYEEVAARRK